MEGKDWGMFLSVKDREERDRMGRRIIGLRGSLLIKRFVITNFNLLVLLGCKFIFIDFKIYNKVFYIYVGF